MIKYKIEVSEKQIRLIAQCLEDVSRFASGQCKIDYTVQEILRGLPFDEYMERRDKVEELFEQIKMVLFPELKPNQSIYYDGSEFIGNTYQIYRTILHQLAIDNNLDNVYSSPALPSGTLGTIKIDKYEA